MLPAGIIPAGAFFHHIFNPLQDQKETLPGLRLGRDNQHLRASRPPARAACWPQRNVNSQKKVLFDGYAAFIPLSRLGGTDPEKRCFCPRFEAQKTPPNRLCILMKWIFITRKWRQTCLAPRFLDNYSTICNRFFCISNLYWRQRDIDANRDDKHNKWKIMVRQNVHEICN